MSPALLQAGSRNRAGSQSGFTRIALIAVLLLLGLLAGVLVPRIDSNLAEVRDAQRLRDVHRVQEAIERFRSERGRLPRADGLRNGWDVSWDSGFVQELVNEGYLPEKVDDPLDDHEYHFAYAVYTEGDFGCVGEGGFYVLGVRAFETEQARARHPGFFRCRLRDWGEEFAFVTGGGASRR